MNEQPHPIISIKKTEEVNIPPIVIESIKQSVESWFNVHGEEVISKVISKYEGNNVEVLKAIQSTLVTISTQLATSLPTSQITIIKEMTQQQAKELVQSYLKENKSADTDELLIKLGIDLETLVKVLDELKTEGKIDVTS